jgi:hypothetical protein
MSEQGPNGTIEFEPREAYRLLNRWTDSIESYETRFANKPIKTVSITLKDGKPIMAVFNYQSPIVIGFETMNLSSRLRDKPRTNLELRLNSTLGENPKSQDKPALTEVVGEMYQEASAPVKKAAQKISNTDFQRVRKNLGDFAFFCAGIAGIFNVPPYILPTVIINTIEARKKPISRNYAPIEYTRSQDIGGYTGLSLGFASLIGQVYAYGHNPKYLAIPLATNILSGLYEWQKHARKKIAERKSRESLNL